MLTTYLWEDTKKETLLVTSNLANQFTFSAINEMGGFFVTCLRLDSMCCRNVILQQLVSQDKKKRLSNISL